MNIIFNNQVIFPKKKCFFTLSVMLCICSSLLAQSEDPRQHQPFLEGNPIWVFKYEHIPRGFTWKNDHWERDCWVDTDDQSYTYYFLGKQKKIEGKVYTMMGVVTINGEKELTVNRWLPVREEDGIVYAITDSLPGVVEYIYDDEFYPIPYLQQGNECVLYNFKTEIGEALFPQNDWATVESYSKFQLMDGTECQMLKTHWEYYDLYEKLGFLNDGQACGVMDPSCGMLVATNGHVYVKHLNAYYQDNMMLYKAPDAPEGLCMNDTCWTFDDAHDYAISYKADPRHEEVMAYIRQLQAAEDPVTYTKGQIATIVLPITPDASKGKYYKLDRYDNEQLVFEEELHPQARIPYIIVPNEDFSIDLNTLDLEGMYFDTIRIEGVRFVGTYHRRNIGMKDDVYHYFILDNTSDCIYMPQGKGSIIMGALRAHFEIHFNLCHNWRNLEYVLHDHATPIENPSVQSSDNTTVLYDLQGRRVGNGKWIIDNGKLKPGIYVVGGKKVLVK